MWSIIQICINEGFEANPKAKYQKVYLFLVNFHNRVGFFGVKTQFYVDIIILGTNVGKRMNLLGAAASLSIRKSKLIDMMTNRLEQRSTVVEERS